MTRLLACLLFLLSSLSFASAATLDEVKSRGKLLCGVNPGLQGFAAQTPEGQWTGFDVDFCKAVAAAVFGDAAKVDYVALPPLDRFQALIEEITSRDPGELLIERIEANAADENSSGSGLGLLTLMNDYGARLGWDFRSSATGGAVMLSTHAALTLN